MLEPHRIRAITLDLDDTLWPIAPTIRRAERVLLDWLREFAPRTAALVAAGQLPRIRERVLEQAALTDPGLVHDLSALRRESLRQALHEADEDMALADQAFEVFFAERQRVELYDDALHALEFLSRRFPVVGLSNGNADVHRVGIGRYFKASLSARDMGLSKPDPRVFRQAAERAGVGVAEVLHVGDDPAADALGALRAGMQVAWLNRGGHEWAHDERPHATVSDLHQLCALLGR